MEENITLILGLYAAGLVVSGLLFAYRLGKAGEKRLCALLGMILGLPLAYAGAKLFFLLHNLGMDIRNWSFESAFRPAWEEMSFTGGCTGFVLGVWLAAKCLKTDSRTALDLFAVPGCILIAFARMAEAGMETISQGDMPSFLPEVFPFATGDDWGYSLAVFTFEALTAVCCAVWLLLNEKKETRPGLLFEKAVLILCAAQMFWEMLTVNYWIPFIISFIHLEQVACAVILLIFVIRGSVRNKKAGPAVVTVLLIALNALMQYIQDKPYLFPLPETFEVGTTAVIVFALTGAGLVAAGLWAAGKGQSGELSSKGS